MGASRPIDAPCLDRRHGKPFGDRPRSKIDEVPLITGEQFVVCDQVPLEHPGGGTLRRWRRAHGPACEQRLTPEV